jgi:outer membrane protein
MLRTRFQFIAAAGSALLSACSGNDTRNLAPATSDTPMQFRSSEAAALNTAVQVAPPGAVDPKHVYPLVELIDIAQRRNPVTRIAWEEARQSAIKVGIAQAAYLPVLTAGALAGYERLVFPFPKNLVPAGFLVSNNAEVVPQLSVKYLLFDFGGRTATVEEARQLSISANAEFTAAHQKLIFNVARAYFMLDGVNAGVSAARQAVADAQVLQQSVEALSGRGLATVVNVDLARRGTAQAQFDLSQAYTAQKEAMSSLLEAMDLPPTTKLRVASVSERLLAPSTAQTVDDVLKEALRRRADLLSDVAKLRASDANIAAARSALRPRVSVGGSVQGNFWWNNVNNSPYYGVHEPQGEALLTFEWPLYDGGLLQNKLKLAESQHEAAADQLKGHTDQALREVALAYDQIETGLRQYAAAVALRTASQAAFRSASDSYAQGVGTLTDAASAQRELASARAAVVRAHAQSLINAAALALAAGLLTSGADFAAPPPR